MFNVKLRKWVDSPCWHRTPSCSETVRPMENTALCGPWSLYSLGSVEGLHLDLTGGSHQGCTVAAEVKTPPSRMACAESF